MQFREEDALHLELPPELSEEVLPQQGLLSDFEGEDEPDLNSSEQLEGPWESAVGARDEGARAGGSSQSDLRAELSGDGPSVWRQPFLRGFFLLVLLGCVAAIGRFAEVQERLRDRLPESAESLERSSEESSLFHEGAGREEGVIRREAHSPERGAALHSAAQRKIAGEEQAEQVQGEAERVCPCSCEEEKTSRKAGITAEGKVILNEANVEELTRLPGIGKRRAEAIVALREKLGRFRRVQDLLRIRGVGVKSLRRLQEALVLDRPVEEESGKQDNPESGSGASTAKAGETTQAN